MSQQLFAIEELPKQLSNSKEGEPHQLLLPLPYDGQRPRHPATVAFGCVDWFMYCTGSESSNSTDVSQIP
jgi:hypothetical protein